MSRKTTTDWCIALVEWFADMPVWWANAATVVLFVLLGLGVMWVPKAVILREAPDSGAWRDLRWWAVALIVVQLGVYYVFS